jgi:hypothetical protein
MAKTLDERGLAAIRWGVMNKIIIQYHENVDCGYFFGPGYNDT